MTFLAKWFVTQFAYMEFYLLTCFGVFWLLSSEASICSFFRTFLVIVFWSLHDCKLLNFLLYFSGSQSHSSCSFDVWRQVGQLLGYYMHGLYGGLVSWLAAKAASALGWLKSVKRMRTNKVIRWHLLFIFFLFRRFSNYVDHFSPHALWY